MWEFTLRIEQGQLVDICCTSGNSPLTKSHGETLFVFGASKSRLKCCLTVIIDAITACQKSIYQMTIGQKHDKYVSQLSQVNNDIMNNQMKLTP
jgi:hypothetical protein